MKERHRCDNCGETFSEEVLEAADKLGLHVIDRLTERIDPGGIVPSGECPDCGALVYPADYRFVPRWFEDLLRELVKIRDERRRMPVNEEYERLEKELWEKARKLLKEQH